MPLFQKSVEHKYLSNLDSNKLKLAYDRFKKVYGNDEPEKHLITNHTFDGLRRYMVMMNTLFTIAVPDFDIKFKKVYGNDEHQKWNVDLSSQVKFKKVYGNDEQLENIRLPKEKKSNSPAKLNELTTYCEEYKSKALDIQSVIDRTDKEMIIAEGLASNFKAVLCGAYTLVPTKYLKLLGEQGAMIRH